MTRAFTLASVMLLAACLSGCGDTHESLAQEQVSAMKDMVATLEGVKDVDSARAAKPRLKALSERMNKINEKMSKLKMPTEAQRKAMEAKHGQEMEQLMQKFVGAAMRIQFNPQIQAELADIDFKPSL